MADIKDLKLEIGNAFTASTGITQYTNSRIYYKYLPDNFRKNDLQLVYEINASQSSATFDETDYSEDYELKINIVYKSSNELYTLTPTIKTVINNLRSTNIRYTEFLNDDLIWNNGMEVYNMYLRYKIVYDK